MKRLQRFVIYFRIFFEMWVLYHIYQTETGWLFMFCVCMAVAVEASSIHIEFQNTLNQMQVEINQEIRTVLKHILQA